MPYKIYILFILHPSQEWDTSITSIGPISDRQRPFHRQLYSSTDGSCQIMEPRFESITRTNLCHLLQIYSLFILHPSLEWDQSITCIGPISDWFRPFQRQLYSSAATDRSCQIMEPRGKSITPTNLRHLLQNLNIIHSTSLSRIGPRYNVYRPNIRLVHKLIYSSLYRWII
jgi:hypothetical protein